MVQWQRHIFPILRHINKRVDHVNHSAANLVISRLGSSFSQGQLQRSWTRTTTFPSISRPIYQFFQHQGISSTTQLLANSSEETPVSSPLAPVSLLGSSKGEDQNQKAVTKAEKVQAVLKRIRQGSSSTTQLLANSSEETPVSSPLAPVSLLGSSKGEDQNQKAVTKAEKVQAVLKGIKQSPKKVNLVAALVRGMLVKDALMQLQLTIKRASKTVYQVIHSARANASHNHGLDPERLIVAEAFVGKGYFKKRVSYHAKGRAGIKHRPECRLTVVIREITPEEEAKIARLRVHNYRKLTKRERRLVPHQLIETSPVWGRKSKSSSQNMSAAAA